MLVLIAENSNLKSLRLKGRRPADCARRAFEKKRQTPSAMAHEAGYEGVLPFFLSHAM